MKKLLLVSTSTTHGTGYLEHCGPQILNHFHGAGLEHVLFVPYALADRDGYAEKARQRFLELGLGLDSIHRAPDPIAAVEKAKGIFVGGGNTFRLLDELYRQELLQPIRRRVGVGMPYMGTSAGSNVACPSIMTTNDMPIVQPPSFKALELVSFQINPHYLDPDPDSTHMGETRETRIREFHEENSTPVVGLREGAMLIVEEDRVQLAGETGARLFRRDRDPIECEPGTSIERLLET